jgi:hypothetical protein
MMDADEVARDTILLACINHQEIGTIANIMQAAFELDGPLHDRLSKAYHECTRAPLTPQEEAEEIGLVDIGPGEDASDHGEAWHCPEHPHAQLLLMENMGGEYKLLMCSVCGKQGGYGAG